MKYKSKITVFSILLSLCALTRIQAGNVPQIPLTDYPHIDGSTACIPLCEALVQKVTGCSSIEAEGTLADFSKTDPSYLKLAQGERDLLLAYEPAQETVDALKEYPPLSMDPVGRDALVFLVNSSNPVDSLTKEELYDIYTGKITNWKEVGGEDAKIEAFQRPETSGSQTMMRKLLLGDAKMPQVPKEKISVGMDDIIHALKEYDNSSNALGYSVYYYAANMYRQKDLKLLKVSDSAPSDDSIQSGEYPLIHEFYCVTGEHSSREALKIRDWLLSDSGQTFVKECGYASIK